MAVYWFLVILTTTCLARDAYGTDTFTTKHGQLTAVDNETVPDYTGAQVLKIKRSPELLELAYRSGFNVWSGNATHVDIMVLQKKVDMFKSYLSQHLIPYQVMIGDLDSIIRMHLHTVKLKFNFYRQKEYKMSWTNYHRLATIHEYMDYLALKYPETVTAGVMGNSIYGRPLKYCKVSPDDKNTNAKAMFVDGGIHAREWVSSASVTYILRELVENRSQLSPSMRNLEYYILPVMNPDGYEYSFTTDRLWRKNRSGSGSCLGTDLNRNFDFQWGGKGSSFNPCSEIYRGKAPQSELETKAVSDFMLNLKGKLAAYLTFHSYGQYILIPYGFDYDKLPYNFEELRRVGDLARKKIYAVSRAKYEVGNTAHLMYPAAGGSDDWAKGVADVEYSYTIELRDRGKYAFLLPPREIIPAAIDAMEAFKVIASAIAN